ncbi:MAG: hypothetical protein JHC26_09775 [Thermofilum sp.]|jgi:hypothetical protein|uniref:hypothetical protein n=1 Tax=Thermofilum sp. TaxID=1961369 RepID=UPI00258B18CD|nr:hypothetical protein [Thermofilum sp.]MCI4409370.1 hypothetical protein [Thermofilum sp.]
MKNNIVNCVALFFRGIADAILYYVVPFIALMFEVLLLSFLLDVFICLARHSYLWLAVLDMVVLYLIPLLYYKTFLKMWDGAKKMVASVYTSEFQMTEIAYLMAWVPSLMLVLLSGASFLKDLLETPSSSIDTPYMVASMLGFTLSMVFVLLLLAFGDNQFKQLFRKCKNG